MKRLSIKLRVTLWFTLLMVLLSALSLALLLYGSAQSGLAARRELLVSMVEDSERELEADGEALDIDRDLVAFEDGVYLSVYDAAGVPLYGMVPRSFDNNPRERGDPLVSLRRPVRDRGLRHLLGAGHL